MKQEEFEKIIVPLGLLQEGQSAFLKASLIGNFLQWKKENKNK